MQGVSCRACAALLTSLADAGIPADALLSELPLTLEYLQNPKNRLSDEDYHALCSRYAELIENAATPPTEITAYLNSGNWQRVLEDFSISVSILDSQGKIIYINRVARGKTHENLTGKSIFDFSPPAYHTEIQRSIKQVLQDGIIIITERPFTLPDGVQVWQENRLSPLYIGNEIKGVVTVAIDITERKLYEQALFKQAVELETVAEVSTQIRSNTDPHQLVQMVCDLTKLHFNLYHVHIYLLDESNNNLVIEAGSGEIGQMIVQSRRAFQLLGATKGVVIRAAQQRRVVVSNNVDDDPNFLYNPYLPDTRAEMAIPIMLGEQLLGILDVQSAESGYFTSEDQRVHQILANQIAVALQNARLVEDIRRQWAVANTLRDIGLVLVSSHNLQEMLERIFDELEHVLPIDAISFWLKNEDGNMQTVISRGFEQFGVNIQDHILLFGNLHSTPTLQRLSTAQKVLIVPHTAQQSDWIIVEGLEWVRSWAGAPIVVRDEIIGWLALDHSKPDTYTPDHASTLEIVSREIALALENIKLLESERQQREMAETLRDIGLVLASSLEREDVLQLVLAQVARLLPYDAASIWLDEGDSVFRCVAQFGYGAYQVEERIAGLSLTRDSQTFHQVNRATVISDTDADPAWEDWNGFSWIKSWMGAPIYVREELIGQIYLDHSQAGFYSERQHKPILESLATQISIAVGNARLFEAERQRRMEIEAFQRGNVSLSRSLDLEDVLDAILDATFDLVPARDAIIYLYQNGKLRFGAGINAAREHFTGPLPEPRPDGLTARVAQSGENIIVENARQNPLYANFEDTIWLQNLQTMIGIALKFGDAVVGVMNLSFASHQDWRRVNMSALQMLANQASIAIENARLYQEVQQHASLLESRVEERTAELERERAQLQAILDGIGDGVIYEEKQEIKYTNHMLTRILDGSFERISHFPTLLQTITADSINVETLYSQMTHTIQEKGQWQGELLLKRLTGSQFIGRIIMTAVYDAHASVTGVATIVRDISQDKELQAQKDRFLSNASHELRTPLANLKTRIYLLQRRPERMEEHLRVIEEVTTQMTDLVTDLLDISRFDRGVIPMQPEKTIVQDLITGIVHIQEAEAQRKHIALNAELPPQPIIASLDPKRIHQVLTNLITNAINYTEEGGTISVSLHTEDDNLLIKIADNGVGIAPNQLNQVFQPFFRAREGLSVGTGLGLSISKEIVTAHNGTITVSSTEGKGSIFCVRLPL